jgi:hypothetical protein
MPVIGRLDEQVDAVLITPLAGKGEPGRDARDARSNENIARPQSAIQTACVTDAQGKRHAEREELPVWLL